MKATWLALAAWLLIGAAATEPKRGLAKVTVRMAPEGVNARFQLHRAVTEFAFAAADVVREGEFELLTPGLTFAGDKVTAARPFRSFALRIRAMAQERDAKYPAHFRIGAGGVVYAPALKGEEQAWRTRLSFRTRPGEARVGGGKEDDGFVFLGPKILVAQDAQLTVIADPKAPQWLVARSRSALAAAVTGYTAALGARLPTKPLLIVKHEPGERNFNVGDATPGAVTILRFHGAAWEKEDAQAAKNIQSFVLHEAFHFWNGGLATSGSDTPAWLHEGGAEYAALLAGVAGGLLSEADAARSLGEALQRCRTSLQASGDKALGAYEFLPAQLRYPCGMAIQWAADLQIRRASGGTRTVLDAWRTTIETARRRENRSYALGDFYTAAGLTAEETLPPIRLLVQVGGAHRWEELPAALNALGAEVAQIPSPVGRRAALLFHLLRENCPDLAKGAGYGFYIDGTTVKLDAPKGCGVLADNPVLKAIEGGDPFGMSLETYAAVQRKCAAKAPVTVTTADGRRLEAHCAAPLADAPRDYLVKRWRSGPHQPLG
ncbi:MAG TPA: hypothetical protein VEZ70_03835 [Allosphingosinicella sp.]|nr:hypothetical protein [Allosphingosinicella sp.]